MQYAAHRSARRRGIVLAIGVTLLLSQFPTMLLAASPLVTQAQPGQTGDPEVTPPRARAKRLTNWNDTAFVDNIVQRKPDLIIVAYGTNEVSDDDWTIESYQRMFAAILRRFRRAAPQASILVYGPPDRADTREAIQRMPKLIQAQKRAALEVGAAFWDSYGAMGGQCTMSIWGKKDRVNFTDEGYVKIGSMFYEDLLLAYRRYLLRAPGR